MSQLIKKIKIETTIKAVTGLHVGGNSENVEIGGIDRPVIKLAVIDNQPYIPGSSIKGKMRCLLEQANGITEPGEFGLKQDVGLEIMNLFGVLENKNKGIKNMPSKLIVRDARMTDESLRLLEKQKDYLDMPYTEGKWENSINRLTGVAKNPRQTERVPAGVKFHAEFVINVWDEDGDGSKMINMLKNAVKMLEADYLGGSGSRGYGQVEFGDFIIKELTPENNWDDDKN